jgi:hypothetical protein
MALSVNKKPAGGFQSHTGCPKIISPVQFASTVAQEKLQQKISNLICFSSRGNSCDLSIQHQWGEFR